MITTLDVVDSVAADAGARAGLVLMGGAMILLARRGMATGEREHQRHVGIASIVLAGITIRPVASMWIADAIGAGPGPDRGRQLPMDGGRRHPARDDVRDRAEHGRQHAHADHDGRDRTC